MGTQWMVVLVLASVMSFVQESEWQHGVIVAVDKHTDSHTTDSNAPVYEISLKVGSNIYVVSYSDAMNSSTVEYRVGADLVVLVEGPTLTFNDLRGNPHRLRILRKEPAPETSKP